MISADGAAWLKGAIKAGGMTRHALARGLCEHEDWRNARGGLCTSSAGKALPGLARALGVSLPAARMFSATSGPGEPDGGHVPSVEVSCPLRELGPVTLRVVGKADAGRWRAMMERHHPRGCPQAPGAVLNYWIVSGRYGCIGGIGFRAASWHVKPRDEWIGWSNAAKAANLGLLVNNHRFLILPGVAVPYLASHVLGKAGRCLPDDWQARHGCRPQAVYTYVDDTRAGSCYRAANWRFAGMTAARARSGEAKPQCRIFMRSLERGWRRRMAEAPRRPIGALADSWVDEGDGTGDNEFAYSTHCDGRVRRRLRRVGDAWIRNAGGTIPEMFPNAADQTAVYRLLSNPDVTMRHVLESHIEAAVRRCRAHRRILAVQDTTMLNYSGLAGSAEGLAPLGGGGKGSAGIAAHAMLAFVPGGRPLGVLSIDADFRGNAGSDRTESLRWLDGFGVCGELAAACPDAETICVGDREMDIWEIHREAARTGRRVVLRACRSKKRRVLTETGEPRNLFSFMAEQPELGRMTIELDAAGGKRKRASRKVELSVQASRVTALPPKAAGEGGALEMLAVRASETDPEDPEKALDWVILSSAGDATPETAYDVLSIYRDRQSIERWFDTLKRGTCISDRKLNTADDLRTCLAFDAVAAWRVHELSRLAREAPDTPAAEIVRPVEIQALDLILTACRMPCVGDRASAARGPPTVYDYVLAMGRIVGFRPSKRQPLPGPLKCFKGDDRIQFTVALIENAQSTVIK